MTRRLVLDTNIRISSLLSEHGACRSLTNSAQTPSFVQLTSPELIGELQETLTGKFRWPEARVMRAVEDAFSHAEVIRPELRLNVCRDPDDNRVLECAVAGRADIILTGDQDLLTLDPFQEIRILSVRQFLNDFLGPRSASSPQPHSLPK